MTLLHTFRGQLPEDRTEVYADAVDLLLRRWESRVGGDEGVLERLDIPGLKMSDLEAGLYDVAFRAHGGAEEAERTADIDEADLRKWLAPYLGGDWNEAGTFVDYIRERAGLLVRHKTEAYTFPHRTFQEFMAACHLVGMGDYPRESAGLVEEDLSRWREVFVLAAGHAARTHRLGQAVGAVNTLCPEGVDNVSGPNRSDFWEAQLAGEALLEIGLLGVRREAAGRAVLGRVQDWLVAAMRARAILEARERAEAGNVLAQLGDPRFREDAWYLPDEPLLGFVEIPEGPFTMGTREEEIPALMERYGGDREWYEWETPQHRVELPAYYVARYPVTVAQFRAFAEDSGYEPRDSNSPRGMDNHPVVHVTWHDALAYCDWLTGKLCAWDKTPEPLATLLQEEGWVITLPSEPEWEKAARGPDGCIFPWGNEADPERANYSDTGIGTTSAVGCFPDGASPYGVEDLSGNVWEWCRTKWESNYEDYQGYDDLGGSDNRVLRGGAFLSDGSFVRCAFRYRFLPDFRLRNSGFRVVASPVRSDL
jgi:formylglycine-generating enzyme required for sulfatase activity